MKKILFVLLILFLSSNVYALPPRSIQDKDGHVLDINSDGSIDISQDGFSITPQTKTDFDTTGIETDTVVWTPASGSRIVLMGVAFSSDAAERVLVESGTTVVIPYMQNTASGLTVIDSGYPIWRGTADATLTYTTGVNSDHSILLWGFEE